MLIDRSTSVTQLPSKKYKSLRFNEILHSDRRSLHLRSPSIKPFRILLKLIASSNRKVHATSVNSRACVWFCHTRLNVSCNRCQELINEQTSTEYIHMFGVCRTRAVNGKLPDLVTLRLSVFSCD